MTHQIPAVLAATAALLLATSSAFADGSGLPGDRGRPGDGVPSVNPSPKPSMAMQMQRKPRAPAIALAVKAAETIAAGCKQFSSLGVAVVNAAGEPILIYVPDGSDSSHGYMALRKAYSAITFKEPTSQLKTKAQQDAGTAAKIKADPNLVAFSGGILLKVGDEIIGALGVSGAEPGGHDEECGLSGVQKIKDQLK